MFYLVYTEKSSVTAYVVVKTKSALFDYRERMKDKEACRLIYSLDCFQHHHSCAYGARAIFGSESYHHPSSFISHESASRPKQRSAVVGKVARKPPPPPQRFLVNLHHGCRIQTPGDDDAPSNRRANTTISWFTHRQQRLPPLVVSVRRGSAPRTTPFPPHDCCPCLRSGRVAQHTPGSAETPSAHMWKLSPLPHIIR